MTPQRWLPVLLVMMLSADQVLGQSDYVAPDQLREQLIRPYSDPLIEQVGFTGNADREPRSSLIDVLIERWSQGVDPEIPIAFNQAGPTAQGVKNDPPKKKAWYEKLSLRGYTQLRYSFTLDDSAGTEPAQYVNDKSVGPNQTFLIRRARLILSGDLIESVFVYLQPDFAITPNGSVDSIEFTQIRDWFADWYFDKEKVYRLRMGQSKVPYGWENMQSSSNRLSLERTDAINSAVRNERDLGLFFYWTPEYAQKFFADVLEQGLKGTGNYGVVALGIYNGQGGSLAEQNHNLHSVARITVPMTLNNGQYVEMSVQGYSGYYVVLSSQIRANGVGPLIRPLGTLETGDRRGWLDQRIAGTFVWYPQPFGFQAEWNVGRGPALNASQTAIEDRPLSGGYAQVMYRHDTNCHGILFPYARWVYFDGGYKAEKNAPDTYINEWELGVEWQINPQIELTTAMNITNRTNTIAMTDPGAVSYGQFIGQLLRFQLQFNY